MSFEQLSNAQLLVKESTAQGSYKVFENKLFRWLCFDDEHVIQSCMSQQQPEKLILPYQQFMMMWQLISFQVPPVKTCILGLGGGDTVRYLQQQFPLTSLLVVEKEAAIAKVAADYFQIKPDQKLLTIEIADAEQFVTKNQQFDLMLIDIVVDNKSPYFFNKKSFWEHCKQNLRSNGVLVVNVLFDSEKNFLDLMSNLQKEFGHLPLCMGVPEHKNIVMLISTGRMPSISEMKLRCNILQEQSDLPFQQCMNVLERDNLFF